MDGGEKQRDDIMSRKQTYRRVLIIIFTATVIFSFYYIWRLISGDIPDTINISVYDEAELSVNAPISVTLESADLDFTDYVSVSASATSKTGLVIKSGESGGYTLNISFAGFIPIKSIKVNVIDKNEVIPCGFPVGLYLQTEGVMVVGSGEVKNRAGTLCSPAENLVESGDYITSLNNIRINSKSQLIYLINKYGSEELTLTVNRNGEEISEKIKPIVDENGEYKIGVWVKDDSQGIGTLTYITGDGTFGALGHGISDSDTGELLNSDNGALYNAEIWGIKKGEDGNPGGLCGVINYDKENIIGVINKNTSYGVFGQIDESIFSLYDSEPMEIGYKQDVEEGVAYIRCMIDETVKDYEINILEVDLSGKSMDKGMVIEITDPGLIEATNGIIQGMSGSPIIQNNKVIGAVTHVFVQDSKKGYGIFIENMLYAEEN